MSLWGRALPSACVRGTTSVLMASATTSCSTTPVTDSNDATTYAVSGVMKVTAPLAVPASSSSPAATSVAPMKT
jgi:hypothetical protein